ncbi:hypothetical protein, partial [Streptosporangium carneum]|uniref:hypothetical protein n=1 Tax=Streptosporangium carneum TaxID=47481 RepID=UPI0031F001AF
MSGTALGRPAGVSFKVKPFRASTTSRSVSKKARTDKPERAKPAAELRQEPVYIPLCRWLHLPVSLCEVPEGPAGPAGP